MEGRKEERMRGRKEDQRPPFQTGLRRHQRNPEAEGGLPSREARPSWSQGRQVQPYSARQSPRLAPLCPLVQAVPAVLQKAARLRHVTTGCAHIKFQFPRTVEQLWVATLLCGMASMLCGNCVPTMRAPPRVEHVCILEAWCGGVEAVPTQRCSKSSGGRNPTSVPPRQSKPAQELVCSRSVLAAFKCMAMQSRSSRRGRGGSTAATTHRGAWCVGRPWTPAWSPTAPGRTSHRHRPTSHGPASKA